MTRSSPEIDDLGSGLTIWHRYDTAVKADLFSTAIETPDGVYLIDPIPLPARDLPAVTGDETVAGIVVTNANHERAVWSFAEQLSAPVFADPAAGIAKARPLRDGQSLGQTLAVIAIEGAAAGEIALHCSQSGGTLIVGDALINFGSHGFDFLPAKYASDPKAMRRSLNRLLEFPFQRILFAHGCPIVSRARERLITLLEPGA